MLKRSVLCNCDIHAEEHSLLGSIAACPGKQSDMTMYYTVNTAFMHYLDNFKEQLEISTLDVNQNWTTQEQILPISLQPTLFDNKSLKAPETLKGLVQQYRQKNQIQKLQESNTKINFFDNISLDIFLFIAVIISMLEVIAIIHLVYKHAKLKTLLSGFTFQPIK